MASIINTVLRGQVIVKTKIFSLRSRAQDVAPRGGYAMSDAVELVPLEQLPQHLQRLRDTKGEAKELIPATKEIYQHLVDNHVQTYKVTEDDGDRYAIVPVPYLFAMLRLKEQTRAAHKRRAALRAATGSASARTGRFRQSDSDDDEAATVAKMKPADGEDEEDEGSAADDDDDIAVAKERRSIAEWQQDPAFVYLMNNMNLLLVGPARRATKEEPVYILTLGEATLKSRLHMNSMVNSLCRRLGEVIDTKVYIISRQGDNSVHILPSREFGRMKTAELLKKHPIDLGVLRLIPGIAKIYDPNRVPQKVLDAEATMKRIEAIRAERVAQGLPPDGDDNADALAVRSGGGKPGQEEVEEVDDAEAMAVSAPVDSRGRPISNPTQFLYHKSRVIVDVEAKRKKHRTVYGEAVVVGAGGLPVMSTARALCLMSGGIDSPVAAYQMMTRGCRVDFVHFLNSTSDTAAILAKLHLIAKRLSILQGRLDLRLVDISELQNAIIGTVNKTDRTVVYKQYMLLLAAAIPGFEILVTGDSVAQVASQTIANIATLYPLTPRSVVSPLSGMNKNDVIDTSRRIGLLDYSAMEGADCCQYLMCKTGANLCIGKAKMQRYLSQIHVDSVPVKVVAFDRGEEIPSAERTEYIPFQSVVVNMPVPVGDQLGDLVARLHPRAAKREEALQAAVANGGTFAPHKSGRASDGGMSADARARIEQIMTTSAGGVSGAAAHADPSSSLVPAEAPSVNTSPLNIKTGSARPGRRPREIYLDSAAASIIDPVVVDAMSRAPVGNPNSLHTIGRVCRAEVEGVRHKILSYLCKSLRTPYKLAFTSGGTEANNIAIQGLGVLLRKTAPAGVKTVVLYSRIAHPSVVDVCEALVERGVVDTAAALPVLRDGHLDMKVLAQELDKRSCPAARGHSTNADGLAQTNVLVVVDLVNHELGTLRDMDAIVKVVRRYGALLHVDAAQALCKVDFDASEFDSVAVTAHKVNGPVGIGAVAMRASYVPHVQRVMAGGSFDSDLRPGTLNVPGIVGFGAALSLPRDEAGPAEALEKLLEGLREMKDVVRVNGSPDRSNGHIVHMTVTGGSPALRKLDDPELVSLFASKYNIMLSTGAACSQHKTGADAASHRVYGALGVEPGPTLRVSFDRSTTTSHVEMFLQALREVVRM
jgi:cysteine sulfinate desulfinase/cysteine desulfurase-like protein